MPRRRSMRGGAITDVETLLPLLGLGYVASKYLSKRRQYGPRYESDINPLSGGARRRRSSRRRRSKRSKRRRSSRRRSKH